jgi:hypothetical protein
MLKKHQAVAAGLIANGIPAHVDYPGCVVIELDPQTTVWTGLHSWTYGTIYRLSPGTMEATDETAEPDRLTTRTTKVEAIVAAWTEWIQQHRPDIN